MSQLSCKMYANMEYYHKPIRIVLSLIGLWPYQCSYVAKIQKVICLTLLLSLTLVQIKQLMGEMQSDWFALQNKREIVILHQYARFGRLASLVIIVGGYFTVTGTVICQNLPLILDVVLPKNQSRSYRLYIITEYFIDQEKYFYFILLHMSLVTYVALTALCGVSSMLMMGILHVCMLFKIASYRMTNALKKNAVEASSPENKSLTCEKIIHAVVIHQRANKFLKFFESLCGMYIILIGVGVTSLTINLVKLLQALLDRNTDEAVVIATSALAHFFYMLIANLFGQQITDHGENLFKASCSGMWYELPLHTQKLLLFVMQKTVLSVTMTVGGIFVASLECFATIKQMLQEMQNNWLALRDKREIVIFHQYARLGRLVSLTLIVGHFILFGASICQFLPFILDIVSPMNESRPFRFIITTEYFVDEEKYFYFILLHMFLIVNISVNAFCGVASILIIGILHACMLYKVARYRMRDALKEVEASSPSESKLLSHKKMIQAILIHQKANEFLKLIESLCGILYIILISVGVMSLTINLVQVSKFPLLLNSNIGLSVFVHFFYMFVSNFCGQQIIDHGESLFKASCSGMWYALPLHTQKLLLFVTQKTVLNVTMTLGGIFVVSLECFSTLASAAVSYFTVFYSARY
ncbi:uncharacterized protein LOC109858675 [Pseudomyrmex gracilis]|uniref:uncharacterized protein LOC109858675 n=1 Tax=Pseudomyrmex gracilis TaxID=219809 RepID=UPI00099511D0|nr:uncharacterized protein LOC109858675 [Pseudomyrmex gracilis]